VHADLGELAQEEPVRLGVAGGREEEGRRPGTRETATRRRAHATHVRLPANDARYDSTADHFNQRVYAQSPSVRFDLCGFVVDSLQKSSLEILVSRLLKDRRSVLGLGLVVKQVLLTSPDSFYTIRNKSACHKLCWKSKA